MAEYIEREALIEELGKSHKYHARNSREEVLLYRDIRIINEQPAADVVEVVRCLDCQKSRPLNRKDPQEDIYIEGCVYCMEHDAGMFETDFCSYGVRRAE